MSRRITWLFVLAAGCSSAPQPPASTPSPSAPVVSGAPMPAPVVPVTLRQEGEQWRLYRAGKAYVIRGAGYDDENLDGLVAAGANAIRTWGIDAETRALLDEAWAKGVSVTLGIWLGHIEHGFDYGDEAAVAAQLARARRDVERFKDHPALLMWGVGNEVELEGGDDPRIWKAIEDVARMIHEIDPHHPTMIVTAEMGEQHDKRIRENCPSIDVWGINSYGGALSIPTRLTERGFSGPIALTEFGPLGDWERPRLPWGATREQTSTEKAQTYRQIFDTVTADPRTVGTYVFVWAPGEQPTDTWYALLGPGGLRYEATDTVAELWGQPPAVLGPSLQTGLSSLDGRVVKPGAPIEATLKAKDPDRVNLTYDWVLHKDSLKASGAGTVVQCATGKTSSFEGTAPTTPGPYRLLGVARDPAGKAAFASARFHVGPVDTAAGTSLPIWVDGPFNPTGWMGDAQRGAMSVSDCPRATNFCSGVCRRFEVSRGNEGWSGVVWHHPEGNWEGTEPGVRMPEGARSVKFMAWGEEGGESITFGVGNHGVDGFEISKRITLTRDPTVYSLPIVGLEYHDVAYGFQWAAAVPEGKLLRFQVADITWSAE